MNNKFISWINSPPLGDVRKIDSKESELNIHFPLLYKNLIRNNDGGYLEKNVFSYYEKGNKRVNSIGYFLCWCHTIYFYQSIEEIINNPPEFFPKGLIPFAPDGGGNYICFDYRNCREDPPIVYWDHGIEENEGVFYLANSFEEFLDMLKSEEEIEAELG